MLRTILLCAVSSMLLASCGGMTEKKMSEVMQDCDTGQKFSTFINCIKTSYKRNPNSETVRSFYAQVDAVVEDYKAGKLSEAKAKAKAYELYDATVGAGNRAKRLRAASGSTVVVNNPTPIYRPVYSTNRYSSRYSRY